MTCPKSPCDSPNTIYKQTITLKTSVKKTATLEKNMSGTSRAREYRIKIVWTAFCKANQTRTANFVALAPVVSRLIPSIDIWNIIRVILSFQICKYLCLFVLIKVKKECLNSGDVIMPDTKFEVASVSRRFEILSKIHDSFSSTTIFDCACAFSMSASLVSTQEMRSK